jgi:hypothetical protein
LKRPGRNAFYRVIYLILHDRFHIIQFMDAGDAGGGREKSRETPMTPRWRGKPEFPGDGACL